ncbi:MAG: stage II sporulation protein M [Gammaproteobacteria bacterium]
MSQASFVAHHEPDWQRLEAGLDALRRGRRRSGAAASERSRDRSQIAGAHSIADVPDPSELPALYRRVCQQLSLAQARGYSRALIERMQALTLRAHQALYKRHLAPWRQVALFLAVGYPRLVREQFRFVLFSGLLFFGPLLAMIAGTQVNPELAYTVISQDQAADFETMYGSEAGERYGRTRASDTDVLMFGFYVKNNTSIGFQTFAGGLLAGIATAFYLLYNGAVIGAVAGYLTANGYGETFWSFVAGHSSPELTAIVLSGAAGLRVGWALLAPGRYSRRRALLEAGRIGVRIVYGAAILFFIAAFVEAFWSSIVAVPPATKYSVGIAGWALLLAYLGLPGRDRAT